MLVVTIAFLHFSALRFYLYWSIWWFDILLHFLGGAWVSALTLWCIFYSNFWHEERHPIRVTLIVTLIVGVLWEVYEYVFGVAMAAHETYILDTAIDLVMDSVGALTVLPLFVSLLWPSKRI